MPKRETKLYLADALEAIDAVENYIDNLSFDAFREDRKTYSATIREYIVIGEAIAHMIEELEEKIPDFPWRIIKDFRNVIVHEYFGVDAEMVWDISNNELGKLKENLLQFKKIQNIK